MNKSNIPYIASHQGIAGGNISYNTYKAFKAAINAGADFIEFDITQSLDGIFYVFHENEEAIRLNHNQKLRDMYSKDIDKLRHINMNAHEIGRVETLYDVMNNMKNHPDTLVHIDHVTKWKTAILLELDKYQNQADQFMIKIDLNDSEAVTAVKNHPVKYMTILIIRNAQELEIALSLQNGINIVGIEILFESINDEQISLDTITKIKNNDMFILVNAIVICNDSTLCAYLDDDTSILNSPDSGWGKLAHLGVDIIQTDWVTALSNYLSTIKNDR
ncbi:glycerophosphodiester phosphodiesterase family protein [Staphylococcus caeli]|uniref:glycerophosphodiester phosphodiesterase family protein n=1 Tax=Staphylococcus caeli TaxID=2201815 RepID=UPI003F57D7FA